MWDSIFSHGDSDKNYDNIQSHDPKTNNKNTKITNIINNGNNDDQALIESISYIKRVRSIFRRPVFVLSMMTISSIYFVVTGVQFWISDYMIMALGATQGKVFTVFALVSITAPTLGVLAGGNICDRLGGYSGDRALDFCLVFAGLASMFAIPIPLSENFYIVSLCLWLLFFFGGAILPTLTGMMLTAIPQKQRSIGSSIAQFVQNLTGYLPAPVLYGYVIKQSGGSTSHWGMGVLMMWLGWGLIFLSLAKYLKYKKHEALEFKRQNTTGQIDGIEKQLKEKGTNGKADANTDQTDKSDAMVEQKKIFDIPRFERDDKVKNMIELQDL